MTDEGGYEVVDKRRKKQTRPEAAAQEPSEQEVAAEAQDAEQEADASPEPDASQEPAEEAQAQGSEEEAEADVLSLLMYVLSLLGASAWQHLGLVMSPVTKQVKQNLPQARLAIDTFEAILDKAAPGLDESTANQLRQSLRDLKVNYIERSRAGR